jgi:uncharacterized protein YgiB involved in biofilm formation
MLKKLRKSSSHITLVLIGLAGAGLLSGCGGSETRRDVYATKEDCLADWGNDPSSCVQAADRPRTSSGAYHYYGRPYAFDGRSAIGSTGARSSRAISTSSVSRGGFGSSGHSSSS